MSKLAIFKDLFFVCGINFKTGFNIALVFTIAAVIEVVCVAVVAKSIAALAGLPDGSVSFDVVGYTLTVTPLFGILAAIVAMVTGIFNIWFILRFGKQCLVRVSMKLYRVAISAGAPVDHETFQRLINFDCQRSILGFLIPTVKIISFLIFILAIWSFMFFNSPSIALSLVVAGVMYGGFLGGCLSRYIRMLGALASSAFARKSEFVRVSAAHKRTIANTKLVGDFSDVFEKHVKDGSRAVFDLNLAAEVPQLVMLACVNIGFISLIYFYAVSSDLSLEEMSLTAVVVFRLLPLVQRVYGNFVKMKASASSVSGICKFISGNVSSGEDFNLWNIQYCELGTRKELKISGQSCQFSWNIPFMASNLIVIYGESGIGKTTLLKQIRRFFEQQCPNSKEPKILYLDKPYLFDDFSSIKGSGLDVFRNISISEFDDYLKIVGLERSMFGRSQLSEGQIQRLAIVFELVLEKYDLVLLDEPTSSLDESNSTAVVELLKFYARKNSSIVVCTSHDPQVIGQADEAVELV